MVARMQDRCVLVTGAAGGIGRAAAHRLAAEGARVAINDRDPQACAAVVEALRAEGLHAAPAPADIAAPEAAERLCELVVREFGSLDVLVNNAGVERRARLAEHRDELWQEVLEVNLSAAFRLSRAAAPHLAASGRGAIVNICSITVVGGLGQVSYDVSKGGLQTLTRSLAVELGRDGVRANAICPGFIDTGMTASAELRRIGDAGVARLPLRRWGRPEDVAAAVLWLASDEASYVTGHSLYVDGGFARR